MKAPKIFSILLYTILFISSFTYAGGELALNQIRRKIVNVADDHFVIIGAGISGLTTAQTLLKSGVSAKRITMINREAFPGGKIHTEIIEGRPYEMGAQIIIPGLYKDIEALATSFGLKTDPLERGFFFNILTGEKQPVLSADEIPAFKEQRERYLKTYAEVWHQEKDINSPYRLLDIDGLTKVHPQLNVPWHEFVKTNNFELIEKALVSLLGGSGIEYDKFNRSYASRIVRALRPELINSVFVQGNPVRIFSGNGFQGLLASMAEELRAAGVEFKLGQEVTKIVPSNSSKIQIHIKSQVETHVLKADQVIYTASTSQLPKLIPAINMWGFQVYENVIYSDYRTFIVKLTGISSLVGISGSSSIVPFIQGLDESGKEKSFPVGFPILLLKPHRDSNIVMISAHGKKGMSNESIERNIKTYFGKLGGQVQIISGKAWEYRPKFSGNEVDQYREALKSQGSGGVWEIGRAHV